MWLDAAGSARTEGYYKISYQEKSAYLVHTRGVHQSETAASGEPGTDVDSTRESKKKVHLSREARSESRRWLNILSSQGEDYGDLLKFNQLKVMSCSVNCCSPVCDVTGSKYILAC